MYEKCKRIDYNTAKIQLHFWTLISSVSPAVEKIEKCGY